jgi:hypothetical protein
MLFRRLRQQQEGVEVLATGENFNPVGTGGLEKKRP